MARDFEEFYRSTFPSMVVLAVAVTAQRAGAEDIVQDAWSTPIVGGTGSPCTTRPGPGSGVSSCSGP